MTGLHNFKVHIAPDMFIRLFGKDEDISVDSFIPGDAEKSWFSEGTAGPELRC